MFQKFAVLSVAFYLFSCAAPAAPQARTSVVPTPTPTPTPAQRVVRGQMNEVVEFCGEFLGQKCANGTFKPKDHLVIDQKQGRPDLVFDYDERIADEVAGRTCDFVVEGTKVKSYSNCTEQ
jgi:hypothetical protein